jgi:hypothetical protein
MSKRRSLSQMLVGGLIEIAAVGILIFLVAGGRLQRGESVSAEPSFGDAPGVVKRDPWRTTPEESEASEPDSLWSIISDGKSKRGGSNPSPDAHGERDAPSRDSQYDDAFVERQLTESAEALQQWLWRQLQRAWQTQ